jgi:hypothetical protein
MYRKFHIKIEENWYNTTITHYMKRTSVKRHHLPTTHNNQRQEPTPDNKAITIGNRQFFWRLELFLMVYVGHQKLYPIFGGPFTVAENLREKTSKVNGPSKIYGKNHRK